jgi:CRISPR-associated protein Csx10
MKLVPLTIEALGPLAFPERKPGVQFRSSLPYVPGAAIYGALGMLLGPQWPGKQEEFSALFRTIRCHNAYPALEGDPWSHPLPMTAIQPKGGKEKGTYRRPYDDSLIARVCWEQQQPAALLYMPTDDEGRPWEAVGRTFYTLEHEQGEAWQPDGNLLQAGIGTREVTQRVLTRVAINRRRGTAEDSRLYSPLVISEVMEGRYKQPTATRFLGSIVVPDEDEHILEALDRVTHIGGRQTTGIGVVQIHQQKAAASADGAQIRRRVAIMTERFREQALFYQALGGTEWQVGTIFTVNLLSDAILLEQGWIPTNELSGDMLAELTRTFNNTGEISYPGINARLIRSYTTTSIVGGWNVSWQRPKQTAVATNMGSVFVFQVHGDLSEENYHQLARLEHHGIGERRAEGYGQIRICDEFHLLLPEATQ